MLHKVCVSSIDRGGALPGGPNYKNSYSSNTAMLCIVRHTAIATAKKSLAVRAAISDILCHIETRITIRWGTGLDWMKKEADSRIDATPGEPRQQGCAGPT